MALTLEKLMRYDSVEDIEAGLTDGNKISVQFFLNFFEVYQQIQSIDQFIKDYPAFPGSTDKIRRSELISSVGSTLAIEGTNLTKEEIETSFQKADLNKTLEKVEREAQNSKVAYYYVIDLGRKNEAKFIYKEDYIKQIHKCLTDNIDYGLNAPGQYRDVNPIFGEPPRRSLCKTKIEVEAAMSKLTSWLNKEGAGPLSGNIIVKAIMAHYYLTEIHPFADGNGRTARTVEAMVLYANKINPYCFWSLANFWSANRGEYIVHLGNIRNTCNPSDFLLWGVKGYLREVQRVKDLILKKTKQLMFMDYVKWLCNAKKQQKPEKKINQRIVGILEFLTKTGDMPLDKFMSSPQIKALYHKRSEPTRYRDFEKMSKLGLINGFEKDNTKYIGPNYKLLNYLEFNV